MTAARSLTLALALAAALMAAGCDDAGDTPLLQGYVEGDYVLVAPQASGRIVELAVARGDRVAAGDLLFRLEADEQTADRAEAAGRLAEETARLADLRVGDRPEELRVIEAEIAEAAAALVEAEHDFVRQEQLAARDFASQSALDAARAARDSRRARLATLERQLTVARMPARDDAIAAAERRVAQARAALQAADWRLAQRTVTAPAAGLIEDTLRWPGEMVGPDRPVISLLPPGHRRVRFFVPQALRSSVGFGDRVGVGCDGCPPGLRAEVTFIATEAEYTPPVIFSIESRQKLVFMIEARPLEGDGTPALYPGQPVDVTLGAGAGR